MFLDLHTVALVFEKQNLQLCHSCALSITGSVFLTNILLNTILASFECHNIFKYCQIYVSNGVAVLQQVAQLSMNPRLSGLIPVFSWLHVEVSSGKTLKTCSSTDMYCVAAVQQQLGINNV